MAVKITYFVHGTTTDNEKEISSGWFDIGLSDLGVKQSIDLKDQIKDKKFDVVFCSDLKRAFSSLYGYTSSAEGIRHALLEETTLGFEDAKFMLVSCSAFINYLISKSSKAGLQLQ